MKKGSFVAFAIEDQAMRDFLKGQSLHPNTDFEYVDMSVKEPYDSNWKEKVRTRIRRSDGVIALVSKNSVTSSGEKWEIKCATEEGVPAIGIWCYRNDHTAIPGLKTIQWTWEGITAFINSL